MLSWQLASTTSSMRSKRVNDFRREIRRRYKDVVEVKFLKDVVVIEIVIAQHNTRLSLCVFCSEAEILQKTNHVFWAAPARVCFSVRWRSSSFDGAQ